MKLKYLLIFFVAIFCFAFEISGQKSQNIVISEIRRDSIVNLLKKFGNCADLFYSQNEGQRYGANVKSNDDGINMFKSLFLNLKDTCIFNYLDTTKYLGTALQRRTLKATDTVPDSKLRYLSFLSPLEYIKLHQMIYSSGEGSCSMIDTTTIRVIDVSERKSFGKKYRIDVLANFSFMGKKDSTMTDYWFEGQWLIFEVSYEKYSSKDEIVIKNMRIDKIRLKPIPKQKEGIVKIDSTHVLSVEPYLMAGINGGKHTFNESFDDYLSGKAGKSLDLGVNFSYPIIEAKDSACFDVGMGVGYSMLTLPLSLNSYEWIDKGQTPPFQPSTYFKEYNYTMRTNLVEESHLLGFVNIPVFARLRIPMKETNMEVYFKLGVQAMVPLHAGYRPDGKVNYTGTFHYVVNNKETVISTDDNDANLTSSIPNFASLYGQKESQSWEKLSKSFGVSSRFETGLSIRTSQKIKYYVGAYVSYNIAGLSYGNDAGLIGQEGKVNSFLTKTDKINPLGFGLTLSASFDVFKYIVSK
jgi:hypothetical protein